MTSLLTSRGLDRLSVWIVWAHNAVEIMLRDGLIPTRTVEE